MSYDVLSTLDPQAKSSRTFGASMGVVTNTQYGRVRFALTNPAATTTGTGSSATTSSTRLVHVLGVLASNATPVFADISVWHNPTAGVPTAIAPIPAKCVYLKAAGTTTIQTPLATVYGDSASAATSALSLTALPAMSGGTQLPPIIVPAMSGEVYDSTPLLIDPGVTIGWDVYLGLLSASGNCSISVFWWEEG